MRRFSSPTSSFTVQVSDPAWARMAHLSASVSRRMREELEALAVRAPGEFLPRTVPAGCGSRLESSLVIGDHVVFYEVNTCLQLITVLELAPVAHAS